MTRLRASLFLSLFLFSVCATAATFTVTSGADAGVGTLRQAIFLANSTPGRDTIAFAVPVVTLSSSLQNLTEGVDIDGDVSGTRVTVTAPCCTVVDAFRFAAASDTSTLKNVNVTGLTQNIILAGVASVQVTDSSISVLTVNGEANIIDGTSILTLTIGGYNNEVYRSVLETAVLQGGGSGNRIGNTSGGGNSGIVAINVFSSTNAIIEGNTFIGGGPWIIAVGAASTGAEIRSNSITNSFERALDIRASDTLIEKNEIFGNSAVGVSVTNTTGVTISRNSIHDNAGLPIDLGFDGPTANDAAPDADGGANNQQNYPLITSAQISPTMLTVTGTLASVPSTTFTIELFSNPAGDPETRTYLGGATAMTDASGNAVFNSNITSPLPAAGDVITATATNQTTGDTSEVSAAAIVVAAPPPAAAEPIPTLSEWALIALAGALMAIVLNRLR